MDIFSRLKDNILILDGSMGALLQQSGMPSGYAPDLWNLEKPDRIEAIHRDYINAGADIIITNTFGATRLRLSEYDAGDKVRDINIAASKIARKAAREKILVAGDIGPLGIPVAPMGELSFNEAFKIFKEAALCLEQGGVDLFIIETIIDLSEMKAAIMAVQSVSDKPIIASLTYTDAGITETGTDPLTAVTVFNGMNVPIPGVNCSTGPGPMVRVVENLFLAGAKYISVEPNAGLPVIENGQTVFPATPEELAGYAVKFVRAGANIIGGCCGTTPRHIELMAKAVKGLKPKEKIDTPRFRIASRSKTVFYGKGQPFMKIGERINPTGKSKFSQALKEGDIRKIIQEAEEQTKAGADALDINVGVPLIDEVAMIKTAIQAVQKITDLPLVPDSSNPEVLKSALQNYPGKALINSVSAEEDRLDTLLPVIKEFGASFIALPLKTKIPELAKDRIKIAQVIVEKALEYGIPKENIIVDALALTVSAMQSSSAETLKTIELIGSELELPSVLGLSNVSFGLPARPIINRSFLSLAMGRGLDAAIINPLDMNMLAAIAASSLFCERDSGSKFFIENAEKWQSLVSTKPFVSQEQKASYTADNQEQDKSLEKKIENAVINGDNQNITYLVKEALEKNIKPFTIFQDIMTPGIRKLGEMYSRKEKFLPHLMAAAQTMQKGAEVLIPLIEKESDSQAAEKIIMATVKGDIHDIGKNMCCLMLKNYGYNVIDLGKDVSLEKILETIEETGAKVIGLSALMTTTMIQMPVVIEKIKKLGLNAKIMVGGAVVTQSFADEIGADGYAADAGSIGELVAKLF